MFDWLDDVFDFANKIAISLYQRFHKYIAHGLESNDGLKERNIESFLKYKSISEYLNYASAYEDGNNHIYLLKDGRYGVIVRIYPPSYPSQNYENYMRTFLKSINDDISSVTFNCFASQNISKQIDDFVEEHPCDVNINNRSMLKKIILRRANFLRNGARNSIYPQIDFTLRDYVNTVSIVFTDKIKKTEDAFKKLEELKSSLIGYGGESLKPERLVSLLREIFFQSKDVNFWDNASDTYSAISNQIIRGGCSINIKDEEHPDGFVIRNSDQGETKKIYVTSLTTKKFPRFIDSDETDELFIDRMGITLQPHIRGPYFTSMVLMYEDIKEVNKKAMNKAQANFNETNKQTMKTQKSRPDMKERKQESIKTIEMLNSGDDIVVPGTWNIFLYDTNKKRLDRSESSIKTSFAQKGWELVPENFGSVAMFSMINSLPLQLNKIISQFLKRDKLLFAYSNHTPIIPFIGDTNGFTNHRHIPTFGRSGQIQWFDYMDSGEGSNISAAGMTGSGKSYTVNDLILLSLGKGSMVRVIDSLPSYKKSTLLLGGQYEDFKQHDFCLNFFTIIQLKRDINGRIISYTNKDSILHPYIADEEYGTIIPIIGAMCNHVLNSQKSEDRDSNSEMIDSYLSSLFEEAVRESFEAYGYDAGMKDVYEFVIKRYEIEKSLGNNQQVDWLNSIMQSLKRFGSPEGQFFQQFNGKASISINSDYFTAELTEVEKKGVLYPLTLMSIANQISSEFFNMNNILKPKILIIEEFWKYKDMPVVLNFAVELSRKVRKAGGAFMPVTQGIDDYYINNKMKGIISNSAWQFFLKTTDVSIDQAARDGNLGLSTFGISLLKSVDKKDGLYGEVAIKHNDKMQISRYRVDGISHYIFTTSKTDKARIEKIMHRFNVNELDAILIAGIQRDEPTLSIDEILLEAGLASEEELRKNKEEKLQHDNDLLDSIKKANSLSNYVIRNTIIKDRDKNPIIKHLEFDIKSNKYDLLTFSEYSKKMIELGLDVPMSTEMLEKAILPQNSTHEGYKIDVSMKVPLKILLEEKFISFIKEKWKPKRYDQIILIIDFHLNEVRDMNDFENYDNDDYFNFSTLLKRFTDLGFRIGISDININIDNTLLKKIKPYISYINLIDIDEEDVEFLLNTTKYFSEKVAIINSTKYDINSYLSENSYQDYI